MSIETRILALADAERQREIERRRAAFDRLVAECPRAAEFVQRVAAEFGKPDAIRIRFADGAEFTRGELGCGKEYPITAPVGAVVERKHEACALVGGSQEAA